MSDISFLVIVAGSIVQLLDLVWGVQTGLNVLGLHSPFDEKQDTYSKK